MKKSLLAISVILSTLSTVSNAGCVGPIVMGECIGTEVNTYGNQDQDSGRYESNTGTQYQYDMNRANDRMQYQYDYSAQRRDQMNSNPNSKTDRDRGQYGGGIYND